MEEVTQTPSTEQATSTEAPSTPEVTLDDVAKQFNVDEVAQTFQPQVQQQPQQQPQTSITESVPDPVLDQAGFRDWASKQNQELRRSLEGINDFQRRVVAAEVQRREEQDLKNAVQTLKSKLDGVEVDDDSIEVFLGVQARKEPRLKQLWDQRAQKPAAWNAALNQVIAPRLKKQFTYKTDPQLAENVRAAKQSTQSSLTTKDEPNQNSIEARLQSAKTPQEFDRIWQSFTSNGY